MNPRPINKEGDNQLKMDTGHADALVNIAASQKNKEKQYWLNKFSGELIKSTFFYDNETEVLEHCRRDSIKFEYSLEIVEKLLKLSNGSDLRLNMIFLAALVLLLNKYTGNLDIVVGSPVLDQQKEVKFINTVLPLRIQLKENMIFKELLLEVKQTVAEATENQNYPIKVLVHQLNLPWTGKEFPLFDVAVLLKNIHRKEYIQHINFNVLFTFQNSGQCIGGEIEYHPLRYEKSTIERLIAHFENILYKVLCNINLKISNLDLLSEEEKKQVLYGFNDTLSDYPRNKTVHELFMQQAQQTPGFDAVIYQDKKISYKELDRHSNRLARQLVQKGVRPNTIVTIIFDWSVEMIVAIMGVLKAGAAYLPIDPNYPWELVEFILKDSNSLLILTQMELEGKFHLKSLEGKEVIRLMPINDQSHKVNDDFQRRFSLKPHDLAYVIYTSGSGGKPKGILIQHESFVEFTTWAVKEYGHRIGYQVLLSNSYAFDSSIQQIFPPLVSGGTLHLLDPGVRVDMGAYIAYLKKNKINNIDEIPVMMNVFFENIDLGESREWLPDLTCLSLGSDYVPIQLVRKCRKYLNHSGKIINGYGPAEASVETCTYHFDGRSEKEKSLIGKPRRNLRVYILDKHENCCAIGIIGEICVSGVGVARGYINNPELTARTFVKNIHGNIPGDILYKTGDQGRWLPNGNVEFLGRIDHQVKIRGYRIELEEIENCLLKHQHITDAVAMARENKNDDKYLCAYIVTKEKLTAGELQTFLSRRTPHYMIPRNFVFLERLPLNPNKKVDRKALPEPELLVRESYASPRNKVEEKLVEIWQEVLNQEKIGIHDNFFDMGGDSLKAFQVINNLHREFNIRISLLEMFQTPTISELAPYVETAVEDKFSSIQSTEKQEYYGVSSSQKRLYILQQMDPHKTVYNMPEVIPLLEKPDLRQLEETFIKLIKRHEILRTSFLIMDNEPVQRIEAHMEFPVDYFKAKSGVESQSVIDHFIKPFDLSRFPLFRVGLMDIEEYGKCVLLIDMHHIISDGISHEILESEFMQMYNGQELPGLRLQYKDFSQWRNHQANTLYMKNQEDYWLKQFNGSIPALNLPTDYPRGEVKDFKGSTITFEISAEAAAQLRNMTADEGVTSFITIFAVFNVFLSKLSGQEDIIVGTPIAGRNHADLEPIIGMFVNTLAIRNYPQQEKTFLQFLREVKTRVLEAFENQDYPLEELVEKVVKKREPGRSPLFDVMFQLRTLDFENEGEPGTKISTGQPIKAEDEPGELININRTSKYDLTFDGVEIGKKLSFSVEYSARLFKKETIESYVNYFQQFIAELLKKPDIPLKEIKMSHEYSGKPLDNPEINFDFLV